MSKGRSASLEYFTPAEMREVRKHIKTRLGNEFAKNRHLSGNEENGIPALSADDQANIAAYTNAFLDTLKVKTVSTSDEMKSTKEKLAASLGAHTTAKWTSDARFIVNEAIERTGKRNLAREMERQQSR